MKAKILCCLLMFCCLGSHAQKKQIKLYLQQIAANKVYIEYLQKGYRIARSGLTTIGNIKNGHYKLDGDFFNSLESVNPNVRNYSKVSEIISLQLSIVKSYKETLRRAKESRVFQNDELGYMGRVFDDLVSGCMDLTDELILIIGSGKLKMSDDERIKRIDQVHSDMKERYVFNNSFSSDISTMTLQRVKELSDAERVGKMYGR